MMSSSVNESHALSMACEASGILRVRIRSSYIVIVFPNVIPWPLPSSRDLGWPQDQFPNSNNIARGSFHETRY